MRETLASERIDGGFRRRESITRTFRLDSEITVEREQDGTILIRRRELSYELGQPAAISHLGMSTDEAWWLVEELTRTLRFPDAPQNGASAQVMGLGERVTALETRGDDERGG